MRIYILALVLAIAFAEIHPVNDVIVGEIRKKATWVPLEPEENPFSYMSVEDIKARLGAKLTVYGDNAPRLHLFLPRTFDAREQWPEAIHEIRDQGSCGSCWAFGATEALSDRFKVEKNIDIVLSPQHLVSCDTSNFGCNGGYLDRAWNFMHEKGVTTEECYPYTSGITGDDGDCSHTRCTTNADFEVFSSEETFMTTDVEKAQQAIFTEGPIEAGFMVYEDFLSYKSGVYQHTSGKLLGGHAVKVVGWGVEDDGQEYWIMANSWGTKWGEDGFFKIAIGDSGVNGQMTFGSAHLE